MRPAATPSGRVNSHSRRDPSRVTILVMNYQRGYTAMQAGSPLAGLRVLELTARGWCSASLAGRVLADLGANVVTAGAAAVPSAAAPARSPAWLASSGKHPHASDLTRPDARDVLTGHLVASDVVVLDRESYAVLAREGLDDDVLVALAPRTVFLCLTPFGLTGPLQGRPGSELTVQAAAAIMATNGYTDDPPVRAGVPVAAMGGALLGVAGALAALHEREASGLGQFLDQAEYDTLIAFLGTWLPAYEMTGENPSRIGNRHALTAPWNSYRSRDGWLIVCTVNQAQFEDFARAIDMPELVDDHRYLDSTARTRNVESLDAVVEEWTRSRTTAEAVAILSRGGVVCGPIPVLRDVLSDEHARHRGTVVPTPHGPVSGRFLRFTPTPGTTDTAGPATRTSVHGGDLGPLHGIRVVEVCAFTAGPLVGRLLGMMGAEVVKVEPPAGEATRHMPWRMPGGSYLYHINNTDKLSCTLDMNEDRDQRELRELTADADVFLSNLLPTTLERNGLGSAELCATSPRLVYGALTGFGSDGPYGGRKALDTVVQALAGIMDLTGFPEREPLKVAVSIADLLGACSCLLGVLVGLLARERTGRGMTVEASLYDASVWSTQEDWWRSESTAVLRMGNRHAQHCPHDCFPTRDVPVALSVETEAEWLALAGAMGRSDLAADLALTTADGRLRQRDRIEEAVSAWTSTQDADAVVTACLVAGVPACVPASLPDVIEGAQTAAREMVVTLDVPDHGPMRLIGSPFRFSRTPVRVRRTAPRLGRDNDDLLRTATTTLGDQGAPTHRPDNKE
ncbi:MAG: hypothetical protein GEV10_18770 [Streptosporangiales bacterium]|nr:hypothetical protein [Streptosporangiales bacterium]